jgi:uncharacterized phage protein gp47/JayE
MSFAAEPYGAFVDDLVSSLTGGITRERFTFLDEQKPFQLAYAADAVASTVRVNGLVDGAYFRFTPVTDFDVVAGVIVWRESTPDVPATRATWPDHGSDFYASYERTPDPQAPPLLTDRNPGSIVRTLAESFAREYAVLSRQLELVYDAGFLGTARGRDLDQVAALVGVTRWTGTVASGEVVFSRSTPAPADIFIPAGTLVSTGQPPPVTVETTDAQTLRSGTLSASAPVRARVAGPAGAAPTGSLTVINRPILGIDAATNPQALTFGGADESDASLRARAGRALEASGGATTDALVGVLTSVEGIRDQDVRIVEDPVASPGLLKITVASQLDPVHAALAAQLIEQARPAGIRVHHNLNVPPVAPLAPVTDTHGQDPGPPPEAPASSDAVWFDIGVTAAVTAASATLTAQQKTALTTAVSKAISAFVGSLGVGDTIVYNRLVAAIVAVTGVYDVSLDLYPAAASDHKGRQNLLPNPPDRRPRLKDANLDVQLRGALIALDVSLEVERKGLAAIADADTALSTIRDDVTQRLKAKIATLIGTNAAITNAALLGALPDTDTYAVQSLVYLAEFLEEGLHVTQQNPEFTPTADQQAWIRSVQVTEQSRSS